MMPVLALVALVSVYAAWLVILAPTRYWAKWLLVPATLCLWVAVFPMADAMLGYAWEHPLPNKFELISYAVVVEGGQKTAIEVWVAGEHSRLYRVPYSKPAEDGLAEGTKKGEGGGRIMMERTGHGEGKNDSYESNIVLPSDDNPKLQDN